LLIVAPDKPRHNVDFADSENAFSIIAEGFARGIAPGNID
jgi:hypothetical protein